MRIQLFDGEQYIEAVGFNDLIDKLERLDLNEIYRVSNGNLRATKKAFRAWPNQVHNSPYDIMLRNDTEFVHLKNSKLKKSTNSAINTTGQAKEGTTSPKKSNQSTIIDQSASSLSTSTPSTSSTVLAVQSKTTATSTTASTSHLNSMSKIDMDIFVKIDQLVFKRADTYVNVIGLVNEIYELKHMTSSYGKKLEVLNFDLIDDTVTRVRVALWGREAKEFNFQKGDCVMLKHVKTCTYGGGMSLSKVRDSFIYTMNTNSSSAITNLIKWHSDWLLTNTLPRSCASLLQQQQQQKNKKKRTHTSIEYSLAKPSPFSGSPSKKRKTNH
jgi:hypothetical protein